MLWGNIKPHRSCAGRNRRKSYNPPSRWVFLFVRRVILSTVVSEFEGEQEYETEPALDLGPLKEEQSSSYYYRNFYFAGIDRGRRGVSLVRIQ
jgi:hypothetical protein